jgi:peptidoglycan hydrolase CwlO-like protein
VEAALIGRGVGYMFSLTKIKEVILSDKKTIAIGTVCLLVGLCIAWYLFGTVQHDRSGADRVRTDISAAQREQQAAAERLGAIENGLDASAAEAGRVSGGLGGVAESIAGAESRIDSSQGKLTDSAGLIAEGQRILAGIRARGQVGTE